MSFRCRMQHQVLGQIIKGFRLPLTDVHRSLLLSSLLPLHKSNEMYEWRDQIPLLQTYHEPLVFCIRQVPVLFGLYTMTEVDLR